MSSRLSAFTITSTLVAGALIGFGAAPAAAAADAPAGLLTSGAACVRTEPGPFLSPVRLNDAQAVTLAATYSGEISNAEVQADFEVWDTAKPEAVQKWQDGASEEDRKLYIQLEDDAKQMDGVTYGWRVRVLDGEQASPWSDTCFYTIDRQGPGAPAVTSADYPDGGAQTGGIGVPGRFTFTGVSADVVSYEYRLHEDEFSETSDWKTVAAPSLGGAVTFTITPRAAGYHSMTVVAVDRAGNRSEATGYDFRVLDTRPFITSTAYPGAYPGDRCCANLDYNVGVPGEFTFDALPGVDTIEWRFDDGGGEAGSVAADADGDATVKIAPLKHGPVVMRVVAVKGTTKYPERYHRFLVDDAPLVTGDVNTAPFVGSDVSFHFTPRWPGVVSYDYWLFPNSQGEGIPEPVNIPARADGTADLTFTAKRLDQRGFYVQSIAADGTRSISRWTDVPVFDPQPTVTRTGGDELGSTATLVARTDMRKPATYTVQFNGDPATKQVVKAAADGTATFRYTVTKTGHQYLHIWAANAAGISTGAGEASWNVSNGPKVTSAEFPAGGTSRLIPGSFTFTPRLPALTHYEYQFNSGPVGRLPATGPATLKWTPTAAGTYSLYVRSYNGSASSQLTTYKFRVAPAAVKITSITPSPVTTGGVRTITLKGANLHAKDVLQVTVPGGRTIAGTIKSVSADGTLTTAAVNLTGVAAGAASVVLRPYGAGQAVATKAFTIAWQAKPVAAKKPSISGTIAVGDVLKAAPGAWSPAANSYAYQWAANGVAIKGATGSSYTIPASLLGKRLTVTVTAKRTGHYPGTATSASTVAVAKGKAPKATKKPKISGTPKAGRKLTASAGTWSPTADSYRYEWRLNGKVIKGATARTLKMKSSWRGKKITVTVIARKAGHADGKAASAALKVR
ncbi:hypothetical protein ACTI_22780 [Actinoplanes sp. OR16]|uniref:hypothetical protein n=1 Tax=Actinoplanes sp. OR16 TaxID=946334 RepID=UPI000F6D5800|nr:hypothetical protein [Actinoplanes sp. OR16]BBH65593.1 hypothetical protein ACTI_22780 [Actinoplanes sp. OR16]